MESRLSTLMVKKTIIVTLLFLAGFFCGRTVCLATDVEPGGNESRTEAVVINVDQWAVYVPNQVFYFDTNTVKGKTESLRRAANRLRNRRALITYYSGGDHGQDKRAMLSDIVPAGKAQQEVEKPPAEETAQPPEVSQVPEVSQMEAAPKPPEEKPHPSEAPPAQSPIGDKQVAAFVEALRLAAPHTGKPDDGLYSDWKVKPGNILRWSKQCTGTEMDPAQFGANPEKAREILACVMGKILREQYALSSDIYVAVCRAASWWMTGDPAQYDKSPTSSYTTKVLGYYMRAR